MRLQHFLLSLEIATLIFCSSAGALPARAASSACIAPPSGLVSWWTGDSNENDLMGLNNPSGVSGVSLVPAEVLDGFSLGKNAYFEVAASASLANQNYTWAAWVKPLGPGTNNDSSGNAIFIQDIDNNNLSIALYWRSTDSRFHFIFGNSSTETFDSKDAFPAGSFYHVAVTYDGSTFRMFVNAVAEGSFAEAKKVPYSTNVWSIGSSGQIGISVGFPRTFNGVIDELQAFNRALAQSELQAIFAAGSAGECKSSAARAEAAEAARRPSKCLPSRSPRSQGTPRRRVIRVTEVRPSTPS